MVAVAAAVVPVALPAVAAAGPLAAPLVQQLLIAAGEGSAARASYCRTMLWSCLGGYLALPWLILICKGVRPGTGHPAMHALWLSYVEACLKIGDAS